jgi:bla regulator protein BlaR1
MIELVGNHLWQSTVFLAAAGLLTLALRTNRAQVRYWVWLAASVKFLIPFAALMAIGAEFGWRLSSGIVQPDMTLVIDAMSQPFSRPELRVAATAPLTQFNVATTLPRILLLVWFCGCAVILVTWWARWRRVAAVVRAAQPVNGGRELDALRQLERIGGGRRPLPLVSSDTSLEPGVFGILKPVLLWPRGIAEHLNDGQIEALLAHELSHVRRRDNLSAAVHMVVEAVFWFHPLVWWLGARLVDERERACDEEVIRLGTEPRVYAESILRTCRYCLESPLACIAGISGFHLKHRIERIMSDRAARQLNLWRRLLLVTTGVVTIAGPIAVGVLSARPLDIQSSTDAGKLVFAVASITPTADARFYPVTINPDGRFVWKSVNLSRLIQTAYQTQGFQRIDGMPSWVRSDRFDVEGKAEGNPTEEQMWSMVRSLIADRFKLSTHLETRELPVYALVIARSDGRLGARIRPSACVAEDKVSFPPGPMDPSRPLIPLPCGGVRSMTLKGTIQARFATMAKLAGALGMLVGRPVQDRTGLAERFDLEVEWTPSREAPAPAAPGAGPAMFAAIEEQLGLRLDEQTGPVRVLVIDHVERPAP